jgi:amidase
MPGDPYAAPDPARPYVEEVEADPGTLRIAVWTTPTTGDTPDPLVLAAVRDAAELLESLGHRLEAFDSASLAMFEGYETFKIRYGSGFAALLDTLGTIGGKPITAEDVEPLTWAIAEVGRAASGGELIDAIGQHQALTRMLAGLEGQYDLVLSPTMGERPVPLGSYDDTGPDPLAAFDRARLTGCFSAAANITGQPAISLPLYWSEDRLPIGVQLGAKFGARTCSSGSRRSSSRRSPGHNATRRCGRANRWAIPLSEPREGCDTEAHD